MNYYEHHLGDYVRDTAHLTLVEDGAYRRLIDAYYVREKPLPCDVRECCKLARASTKVERNAVAYVLKEFFELTAEGYRQKRCDEVIAHFYEKKRKATDSANARWSAQKADSERNANASETHMRITCEADAPNLQSPVTSNQSPEESSAASRAIGKRTPAGEMAITLRDLGVRCTSLDETLLAWIRDGYTVQQVTDAVALARLRKPYPEPIPVNYIDPILRKPQKPPQPQSQADRVTWRPPPDDETERVPN